MGFDLAQITDFTDGEIALVGYCRKFVIVADFQHKLRRVILVFALA